MGEPDGRVFPQEGTKGDGSSKKKFADYIIRDLGLGIDCRNLTHGLGDIKPLATRKIHRTVFNIHLIIFKLLFFFHCKLSAIFVYM